MSTQYQMSLKGHFLIAMPALNDPNFSHTVVCMCEHNQQGSIGLVINRTYPSLTAKELFQELKIETPLRAENIPIHYGGPVHTNEVFILHGPPLQWYASMTVTPFLAMTNTRDLLEAIAQDNGPDHYIISLGCAGWGPNQLENELMQNAWLTYPISSEIIFELPVEDRWEEAVKTMGINPGLLTDAVGHA